ncbi:MAG TPA: hypothetical protein PLP29_00890 [Candidatus Ozemobacteraceae bacterium]|nr:hypothetical protein [Candidatus Ozemobacteraceae bacterium]
MNRGVTLVDMLLTITLCSMLFVGGFRLISAERRALVLARENTLALYALEGLRNRILSDIMREYTFNSDRLAGYIADIKLPHRITWKLLDPLPETAGQRVLQLRMETPERMHAGAHAYIREVILP